MKNTLVISAFPCCGKTYACKKLQEEGYTVWDSDSSQFSWITKKIAYVDVLTVKDKTEKVRNPDFPKNYIKHIQEGIGKVDIIFVSSHQVVRDALNEAGIKYILVYPREDMLTEWIGRAYIRGSGDDFCNMLIKNWDSWISLIKWEINDVTKPNKSCFLSCQLSYDTYLNLYSYCKRFLIPTYFKE